MNRMAMVVTVAVLVAGAGAVGVPAQQPAPLQTELLAEVRLLRQSIEALAGTNARVQIVFGRLQLQEQRTATAARRLDDLRRGLAAISMRAAEMADSAKALEAYAADSSKRPEDIERAGQELTAVRRELSRIEAERTRLMGEEAEAAATLNLEQGRWSDLNRQLEELERLLTPKQ
jgi:chromosome segregation ATPase